MSCLEPGRSVEGGGLILPLRFDEAALAIEDVVPRLVNAAQDAGDCRAIAAITDRFENCVYEQTVVDSVPEAGGPIMPLAGEGTTQAILDSWLAKGTVLGADGEHCVFVAFMDVMRRPLQGSWTVESITVLGTKQSVVSLMKELQREAPPAGTREPLLVRAARSRRWGISGSPIIP